MDLTAFLVLVLFVLRGFLSWLLENFICWSTPVAPESTACSEPREQWTTRTPVLNQERGVCVCGPGFWVPGTSSPSPEGYLFCCCCFFNQLFIHSFLLSFYQVSHKLAILILIADIICKKNYKNPGHSEIKCP